MKRGTRRGLMLLGLLLAGLLAWQIARLCRPANPYRVDPAELRSVELARLGGLYPARNPTVQLTGAADLETFCALWNQETVLKVRGREYLSESIPWRDSSAEQSVYLQLCFVFQDGSRQYFALNEEFLYFCGKQGDQRRVCYFHTGRELVEYMQAQLAQRREET